MNKEIIPIRREREAGEIITDSFKFVRQNYKSLFKVVLRTAGPILLFLVVSMTAYNLVVLKGTDFTLFSSEMDEHIDQLTSQYAATFFFTFILFLALFVVFYALFYGAINYSLQSYMENNGEIDIDEAVARTKSNWLNMSGLVFLSGVVLFFGFLLCFLPGLYLMVPLSLVFSIMVFQNMGINSSFAYSFKLIKGNWLTGFITLVLMILIYFISSFIIQIPMLLYFMFKGIVVTDSVDGLMSDIMGWPYYLINLLGSLLQFVLSGILVIAAAFLYFTLDERQNRTGAFEEIDRLGRNRE